MSLLGLCPLQPARTTLSSSSIERLVPPHGSIRGSILSPPPWGLRAVGGPADHSSFWRRFSSLAPRTPPSPSSVYSLVTTSRQSLRATRLPDFPRLRRPRFLLLLAYAPSFSGIVQSQRFNVTHTPTVTQPPPFTRHAYPATYLTRWTNTHCEFKIQIFP